MSRHAALEFDDSGFLTDTAAEACLTAQEVLGLEIRRKQDADAEKAALRLLQGVRNVCEDCGAEIPKARLVALESATKCLGCQRAAEERESLAQGRPKRR